MYKNHLRYLAAKSWMLSNIFFFAFFEYHMRPIKASRLKFIDPRKKIMQQKNSQQQFSEMELVMPQMKASNNIGAVLCE